MSHKNRVGGGVKLKWAINIFVESTKFDFAQSTIFA